MHQIDDSFRRKREQAREARIRALRRKIAVSIASAALLAGSAGAYFHFADDGSKPTQMLETKLEPDAVTNEPSRPVFVNAIVDLAGDPLIIRLDSGSDATKLRELPLPPDLLQPNIPDTLEVLSEKMLSSSQRIMALPSSPHDFAFFQSQSGRARLADSQPEGAGPSIAPKPGGEPGVVPAQDGRSAEHAADESEVGDETDEVLVPVAGQDDLEADGTAPLEEDGIPLEDMTMPDTTGMIGESGADVDAGWGETVGQTHETLRAFKPTAIADTTTVHIVKPEIDRFLVIEDFTLSIKGERTLESIVAEYGFSADDAKNAHEAAKGLLGVEMLSDRTVVALRGFRTGAFRTRYSLAQLSINRPEKYIGTIALGDNGKFVAGADPWIDDDLSHYSAAQPSPTQDFSYRLLDAIYSTATRNQVPSGVTGETIMLLSRAFDLQAMTARDDRLVIIFSKSARDQSRNAGRVLYAAIQGPDRSFECFVYRATPAADFSCMSETDATHSITSSNGLVNPVNGVLTSTFGPRLHPILGKVRLHKGVDWKAPIGTPVMAAFDGSIEFVGDGKGYGNVIRIAHGPQKATAYAHLSRFQTGVNVGLNVKAGDIIGYVGTTGLSTGPHLHFELYMNGVAIDPLATAVAQVAEASDGTAVELLVNRIIHVESAGNARAKNPLSTATGLGQFIKSTWIRMMKTYRADLYRSMSEKDLLALRFDPTISREMVGHLARENEARLRSHGHGITSGRLYLAHFLGPEGAHTVLAAPSDASLAAILGTQVISANPFLSGKNAAYVIAWAEKKMTGKARVPVADTATVETVVRASPEFLRYRESMQKVAEMAKSIL